jgi:hypothetical protein
MLKELMSTPKAVESINVSVLHVGVKHLIKVILGASFLMRKISIN